MLPTLCGDGDTVQLNRDSYIDFKSALEKLPNEELILLKLHFIQGLSLQELAFVFNKHPVNICIQRKKIVEKLRAYLNADATTCSKEGI